MSTGTESLSETVGHLIALDRGVWVGTGTGRQVLR